MELVCFQGQDKENLGQINALVKKGEWEKVFIVRDKNTEKSESDFELGEKCEVVSVDSSKTLIELKKEITEKLKSRLHGEFEVGLSIASGNGKEHMALLSALLNVPVGIKLTAFTKNGVEFLS